MSLDNTAVNGLAEAVGGDEAEAADGSLPDEGGGFSHQYMTKCLISAAGLGEIGKDFDALATAALTERRRLFAPSPAQTALGVLTTRRAQLFVPRRQLSA